jgi:uncharacterized protein YndB with AHSA1/START domain
VQTASDAAWTPPIGDAALQAKTGKTWNEWLACLDAAGARELDHKGIVAILDQQFGVPGWWCQMVTVGYEQARGRREKHQKVDGYTANVSRTIGVPVGTLYAAWADATMRRRWLQDADCVVRKANPDKSLRITWIDGKTSVDVYLTARGAERSQVAVQHTKLQDRDEVARLKAYWAEQLDHLVRLLQGG